MTEAQKKEIADALYRLNKKGDRNDERMEKAEADGDMEKYKKLDHLDDVICAEIRGMKTVLLSLGYYPKYDPESKCVWILENR